MGRIWAKRKMFSVPLWAKSSELSLAFLRDNSLNSERRENLRTPACLSGMERGFPPLRARFELRHVATLSSLCSERHKPVIKFLLSASCHLTTLCNKNSLVQKQSFGTTRLSARLSRAGGFRLEAISSRMRGTRGERLGGP